MNDVQMQMMSLQRHHRILERLRAEEAAAAKPAASFAAALDSAAPAASPTPIMAPAMAAPATALTAPEPSAEPQRTLANASPSDAGVPQLSADQAALLAASLGATLPEDPAATAPISETAATKATPDLSDDQMAALMSAFGHEAAPAEFAARQVTQPQDAGSDSPLPQTAAAMAATAIPQAQGDNLRYFPINHAAQPEAAATGARQMAASDTYLRAMQQMERNLGAYGGLTGNGR